MYQEVTIGTAAGTGLDTLTVVDWVKAETLSVWYCTAQIEEMDMNE
jgi:hypothetical protein